MYEIRKNGQKIAAKVRVNDIEEGLTFFTDDEDFLQIGAWRYAKGTNLEAHNHNFVPREVSRTQEFVYVVKGAVKAFIYDEEDEFIEEVVVKAGEALFLFAGGHGYQTLAEDTVVFEVKNGPYPGAEKDRRRLPKPAGARVEG